MNINPGELNKRIQIIEEVSQTDDEGFGSDTIEKVVRNCYAKVSNISGTEMVRAGANFNDVKKRFLVRHSKTPINTDMLIKFNGINHNIIYINNYTEANEYDEIWTDAKELV